MNRNMATLIVALVIMMLALPALAFAEGKSDLAEVRAVTARFHRPEVAQAAGYDLVPGLDHCFVEPGVGAMGYHYINLNLLMDGGQTDPLQPEALVYAPGPDGQLMLAAVEYVVPFGDWDDANPNTVLGQSFLRNDGLGIYARHVWIFKHNPDGMFASWNPEVSCP